MRQRARRRVTMRRVSPSASRRAAASPVESPIAPRSVRCSLRRRGRGAAARATRLLEWRRPRATPSRHARRRQSSEADPTGSSACASSAAGASRRGDSPFTRVALRHDELVKVKLVFRADRSAAAESTCSSTRPACQRCVHRALEKYAHQTPNSRVEGAVEDGDGPSHGDCVSRWTWRWRSRGAAAARARSTAAAEVRHAGVGDT